MRKAENGLLPLFQKYLSGSLTSSEREQFLQLAADPSSAESLKTLIAEEISRLESGIPGNTVFLSEEKAKKLFEQITAEQEAAPVVPLHRRWYFRAAAAAAILFLLSGLYYLRPKTASPQKPVMAKAATHDVAPGMNGAILTLANGSHIVLDSLHNGNITNDGNAAIAKNGQGLTYTLADNHADVVMNTLSTPRARQYQLTLPDGTKVWLNAESSITYPTAFNGKERVVKVSGETYFEVAENKQQPFFVQYGDNKVEVVGTHFNVNAYEDESMSRVTLLQGSIRMHHGNRTGMISPGQQAVLSASNAAITVLDEVDTDQVMAWKNGHFDFREADLKTLMRQLMRWYDVDVEYQGNLPERYFTADVSRNKNLSAVLEILQLNKIHFRIDNRKIIVTP